MIFFVDFSQLLSWCYTLKVQPGALIVRYVFGTLDGSKLRALLTIISSMLPPGRVLLLREWSWQAISSQNAQAQYQRRAYIGEEFPGWFVDGGSFCPERKWLPGEPHGWHYFDEQILVRELASNNIQVSQITKSHDGTSEAVCIQAVKN